ncbi:MAG: hypothetical protein M1822_006673 [Bathelium mastoideum]|nr:MAG: hypothetical protein M1822_006673 [Bathelium mastoideum]
MALSGGPSHDDIMDNDTELQMLINDVPPFFCMSKTELTQTYGLSQAQAGDIVYQGHTIFFLLNAQRCKLHLPYFTRGYAETAYAVSREICVKSARLAVQTESKLENSGLCTALRFKFAGLLVGVFMATIVLLMDLCINKSSSQHEKQQAEVAEALRILEDARNDSETTATFVDSLTHVLQKYKAAPPKRTSTLQTQTNVEEEASRTGLSHTYSESMAVPFHGASSYVLDTNDSNSNSTPTDDSLNGEGFSYFNELAQSLEQGIDAGTFDWHNLFSDLESSFI